MISCPNDIKGFEALARWWRTDIFTEIVTSGDGVGDLQRGLKDRARRPFFIIDRALEGQAAFEPLFATGSRYVFSATSSEPRTEDVDRVVELIKNDATRPDTVVGVGGGGTMDLAKAVSICTANPKKAQDYQGFGLEMNKGLDIWVMPTLQGTGAEVTPIAVLRGPERKLGINNRHTAAAVAVLDPRMSRGVPKVNRFYTMMDCFFHLHEIMISRTSAPSAIEDAREGRAIAAEVLSSPVGEYDEPRAIRSAMASVLGGCSSITGRVGVSHALSYGLSNCAPKLPHSVAVTISMLACEDIYKADGGYEDTVKFLEISGIAHPRARDYGITEEDVPKMTRTALGMELLWLSHYGDDWKKTVDEGFVSDIYRRIVAAV